VSHANDQANRSGFHQLDLQRFEGEAECASGARVPALETLLPAPGLGFSGD